MRSNATTGVRIIVLPMPELSDNAATPDGIDFAYQVAAAKLASQLDTIDKLDAKLGVLIVALVTLASLYTATAKSAIAALILAIPSVTAAFGYASRSWANPPDPVGSPSTQPGQAADAGGGVSCDSRRLSVERQAVEQEIHVLQFLADPCNIRRGRIDCPHGAASQNGMD